MLSIQGGAPSGLGGASFCFTRMAADTGCEAPHASHGIALRPAQFKSLVESTLNFMLAYTAERPAEAFLLPFVRLALQLGEKLDAETAGAGREPFNNRSVAAVHALSGPGANERLLLKKQTQVLEGFLGAPVFAAVEADHPGFLRCLRDFVYADEIFGHIFVRIVNVETLPGYAAGVKGQADAARGADAPSPLLALPEAFPRRSQMLLTSFMGGHVQAVAPQLWFQELSAEVIGTTGHTPLRSGRSSNSRRPVFYKRGYADSLVCALRDAGLSPKDPLISLLATELFLDGARHLLLSKVKGYCDSIIANWNRRGAAQPGDPIPIPPTAPTGWLALLGRVHAAEKRLADFREGWEPYRGGDSEKLGILRRLYRPALLYPTIKFCKYVDTWSYELQLGIACSLRKKAVGLIQRGETAALADLVVGVAVALPRLLVPMPELAVVRKRGFKPPETTDQPISMGDFYWHVQGAYAAGLVDKALLERAKARIEPAEIRGFRTHLVNLGERSPEMEAELRRNGKDFFADALGRVVANLRKPYETPKKPVDPEDLGRMRSPQDDLISQCRPHLGKVFYSKEKALFYYAAELPPCEIGSQMVQLVSWGGRPFQENPLSCARRVPMKASTFLGKIQAEDYVQVDTPEGFERIRVDVPLLNSNASPQEREYAKEMLEPVLHQRLWDGTRWFEIASIDKAHSSMAASSQVTLQPYADASATTPQGGTEKVDIITAALWCQFGMWLRPCK